MCSLFWQMENDQGDLSDILRVGGSVPTSATTSGNDWSFPAETEIFPTRTSDRIFEDLGDLYGGGAQDRSLHESAIANSMFLSGTNALTLKKDGTSCCFSDGGHGDSIVIGDEIKSSQTLLTRMLQIDPNPKIPIVSVSTSSPRSIKPVSDDLKVKSAGESNENRAGVQQMNSPRNPGIKRRKNQTKKVVCIPAPAAANSRPSGEVVPSDLWAWRKYGQKPIKGSPYPRGYYRCSSSKGCSARKQVERSRTDPNMLVITYTSEHNHTWPTQRNALAGSTRTPASKAAGSKASLPQIDHTPNASEEELKDDQEEIFKENDHGRQDESLIGIKQELGEADKFAEIGDGEMGRDAFRHSCHLDPQPDSGDSDDFFLELGELESDPLSLIFPHEFSEEKPSATAENKGTLDPSFGFFDWSNGQSSFVDSRKDS